MCRRGDGSGSGSIFVAGDMTWRGANQTRLSAALPHSSTHRVLNDEILARDRRYLLTVNPQSVPLTHPSLRCGREWAHIGAAGKARGNHPAEEHRASRPVGTLEGTIVLYAVPLSDPTPRSPSRAHAAKIHCMSSARSRSLSSVRPARNRKSHASTAARARAAKVDISRHTHRAHTQLHVGRGRALRRATLAKQRLLAVCIGEVQSSNLNT